MKKPRWMTDLPISARLILSFLLLLTLLTGILMTRTVFIYSQDTVGRAGETIGLVLKQATQDINNCLAAVEDTSTMLVVNRDLTDFFMAKPTFEDMYRELNTVTETIASYYFQDYIYTVQLYTPEYVFGSATGTREMHLPRERFPQTSLYQLATSGSSTVKWHPTYDYADMHGMDYLRERKRPYDYQYLFTAVRQMDFVYVDRGTIHALPPDAERPILMVHISAEWLQQRLAGILPYEGVRYWVLDDQDRVVYTRDMAELKQTPPIAALLQGEGFRVAQTDGEETLICSSRLPVNGWRTVVALPLYNVTGRPLNTYLQTMAIWAAVAWASAGLLAALFSRRLTRPIRTLLSTLARFSEGDFTARAPDAGIVEFRQITEAFNNMGAQIQHLIRENYEIRLRNTEAELMALNLQVNPHFLGNTLNVINLTALQNGQGEISRMIGALSSMLQYAVSDRRDSVPLREELHWLDAYNTLMQARFLGMYDLVYDVPEELLSHYVPKLILQPIVENAFRHGKIGAKPGGWIRVGARTEGDSLRLTIENNGVKFSSDTSWQGGDSGHIGLANVYARLRLLYGDDSGVTVEPREGGGTLVTLLLQNALKSPSNNESSN